MGKIRKGPALRWNFRKIEVIKTSYLLNPLHNAHSAKQGRVIGIPYPFPKLIIKQKINAITTPATLT